MKKILHWLVPREKEFFELLAEQSSNALEGAKELKIFIDDYGKLERGERKARAYAIKNIENKGDSAAKKIFDRLDKNFRAAVDREDIQRMAVLLDDITDLISDASSKFVFLSIERIDDYTAKFADVILEAVGEVDNSILDLKKLKGMESHCAKIRGLEKDADKIYGEALSELFHFYKNSIDIMKYRDIYELLESIADKCKDVANVLGSIAAKHA